MNICEFMLAQIQWYSLGPLLIYAGAVLILGVLLGAALKTLWEWWRK